MKTIHVYNPTTQECFNAGYDAAKNGSNETNTHFKYFSSKERMLEWTRGKEKGEKEKEMIK